MKQGTSQFSQNKVHLHQTWKLQNFSMQCPDFLTAMEKKQTRQEPTLNQSSLLLARRHGFAYQETVGLKNGIKNTRIQWSGYESHCMVTLWQDYTGKTIAERQSSSVDSNLYQEGSACTTTTPKSFSCLSTWMISRWQGYRRTSNPCRLTFASTWT